MSSDKRDLKHTAEAAGGTALALGTPAVSRVELKTQKTRLKRVDSKIAATQAKMPKKPDPESRRVSPSRIDPENPKAKFSRQQETKRVTGEIKNLQAKRNVIAKPKVFPKQTKLWGAGLAMGVPMAWHGARNHKAVEKRATQRDVDAATAGGVAGFAGYQGGSLALKPLEKPYERKIKADPKLKEKLAEHRTKTLPKNVTAGHPAWKEFNRKYPKDLPGAKMKRVNANLVSGKRGGLATLGVTAGAAAGAVALDRKHRVKKNDPFDITKTMSDREIKHRKKVQGTISRTTSTLGLGGLGVLGASAVARRKPGALKAVSKVPGLKNTTPDKLKETAQNTAIISGGIGAAGGFNFAAYTAAESKKRRAAVKKSHEAFIDLAKAFDSEKSRERRNKGYQAGTLVASGVGGAATAHYGSKYAEAKKSPKSKPYGASASAYQEIKSGDKAGTARIVRTGRTVDSVVDAKHLAHTRKMGKLTLAAAAGTAGAIGANNAIKRKRQDSWKPYVSKAANGSAFGVVHD